MSARSLRGLGFIRFDEGLVCKMYFLPYGFMELPIQQHVSARKTQEVAPGKTATRLNRCYLNPPRAGKIVALHLKMLLF